MSGINLVDIIFVEIATKYSMKSEEEGMGRIILLNDQ